MTRLFGKSAFITGAAQGIGFEFAKAYVAEGAKVVLADIDQKKVRKAALELGDTAFAVVLDVRDQESINLAVEQAINEMGCIDILINNAALFTAAPITDIDRQMHGGMMGGGMNQMGAAGAMGGTGPMGMMDQDMMALMRGPMMGRFDADADGDGLISSEEAHGKLQSMHADADTNGDGSLTLEEFEALHGEIIRSMMVDRFQHLDTDGDGLVTAGEMTAPADRMGMRPPIQGMMGDNMGTQDN